MTYEEGPSGQASASKPKVRVIAPIEGLETKAQMAPISISAAPSRMCAYHQTIPAVYICAKCSKPLCFNCAVPHGHLYLCPQCYLPERIGQAEPERKEPQKPPLESILGLFGGLMIITGFFMPWATSEYVSPRLDDFDDSIISGFTIAGDYPEVSIVLIMAILILVMEFLLIILTTSPMMIKKPPIGVRLLPMFLGCIAYVVLAEIVLRAESLLSNIHVGWFVCVFGASVILFGGAMEAWKHYQIEGD